MKKKTVLKISLACMGLLALAGCGDQHGEAGLLQRFRQEAERFGRIVHQQDDIARGGRLGHGRRPFSGSMVFRKAS